MRNCEECIYQIKGSCSKFECKETTIEQFEQEIRDKVIDEFINHLRNTWQSKFTLYELVMFADRLKGEEE